MPTRTFLDTSVLLSAWNGTDELHHEAVAILEDPNRDFLSTSLVELETVPHATHGGRADEVAWFRDFFDTIVSEVGRVDESLVSEAHRLSCATDIGGMDAMHVAAGIRMKADQFVTREKKGKPMHSVPCVVHIQDV